MTDHTPISKVSRLDVISTGARRRWTLDEKQRIVAESYSAPRVASVTARRNGLSASQLFPWGRLAREGLLVVVPKGYDEKKIPSLLKHKKAWIADALKR